LCILKKTATSIHILDWRIISLADKKKDIKGIDDISERIYMELDNIIGELKEKGIEEIAYVLDAHGIKTYCYTHRSDLDFTSVKHFQEAVRVYSLIPILKRSSGEDE
jgi:hypothetical protein